MSLVLPALPLVGAVVGGLWYGLGQLLLLWNVSQMPAAALLTLCPYVLTGFIHLDGYMDTCDAVLSRRSLTEKRRILKDPHTGAFSVICLAALFLLVFCSTYALLDKGKIPGCLWLIPVMARTGSAVSLPVLKPISAEGSGYRFGKDAGPGHWAAVSVVVLIVGLLGFFLQSWGGLLALGAAALGYVLAMRWAYRSLGGISGDLTGFALTMSELAGIFTLALI